MESDVQSCDHDEVEEPGCITRNKTRGKTFRQLDNIHESTSPVSNIYKTNKKHPLIRMKPKK